MGIDYDSEQKKKKVKKTKEGAFSEPGGVKRHFVLLFFFIFEISSGRLSHSVSGFGLWYVKYICTYLAYAYIHTAIHNENSDKTFWEDLLPCYRLLDTSSRKPLMYVQYYRYNYCLLTLLLCTYAFLIKLTTIIVHTFNSYFPKVLLSM